MSSKVLDDWILFPTALKLPVSSKFRPSPDLDLDQFCQAEEQAKLNSFGGLTSILATPLPNGVPMLGSPGVIYN